MSDDKSIEAFDPGDGSRTAAEPDAVAEIRAMLRVDRPAAVSRLVTASTLEKQRLFLEIIALASFEHPDLEVIRREIRTLPREWVLANIETAAEFQLMLPRADGSDEFRLLHQLYLTIDRELADRLADRGRGHQSEVVRSLFSAA